MSLPEGWEMVVGLEVHTELLTATKLFCGCANAFGAEPNTQTCPVCLGLPGSLPVLNRRAVELAMAIGLALHATVSASTFHRKNYFYPDMPKDFQISQYDRPINTGGYLDLPDGSRVGIERAHLEEDTGKSTHLGGTGRAHEHPRGRLGEEVAMVGDPTRLDAGPGPDRQLGKRHAEATSRHVVDAVEEGHVPAAAGDLLGDEASHQADQAGVAGEVEAGWRAVAVTPPLDGPARPGE